MLTNDILLDLARAAANGGGKAVEIRPVPIAIIDGIFIANIIARARALEPQREFSQLTHQLGPRQLVH